MRLRNAPSTLARRLGLAVLGSLGAPLCGAFLAGCDALVFILTPGVALTLALVPSVKRAAAEAYYSADEFAASRRLYGESPTVVSVMTSCARDMVRHLAAGVYLGLHSTVAGLSEVVSVLGSLRYAPELLRHTRQECEEELRAARTCLPDARTADERM
jgi:hypothetical protein